MLSLNMILLQPKMRVLRPFFRAAPGGVRTTEAFSQNKLWPTLDNDREKWMYS